MGKINLLAAVDLDGCIGNKGNHKLQWRQSADMIRFRQLTTGNVIIMGYNTFASLDFKGLPNRANIVISKNHYDEVLNSGEVIATQSLEEAIELAKTSFPDKEIYIIGGAAVYNEAIKKNLVQRMYFTVVKTQCKGDALINVPDFGSYKYRNWATTLAEKVSADEKNEFPMIFLIHEERNPNDV